jgi:hypothetical protein
MSTLKRVLERQTILLAHTVVHHVIYSSNLATYGIPANRTFAGLQMDRRRSSLILDLGSVGEILYLGLMITVQLDTYLEIIGLETSTRSSTRSSATVIHLCMQGHDIGCVYRVGKKPP